jgi:hypothetical protein
MDWEEWEERYEIGPDELGEMVESLIAQEGPAPTFRATIRGGRVWLSGWSPEMSRPADGTDRPLPPDVAVADLTVPEADGEGDRRHLIVRFLCRSEGDDDIGPLIDWASRTGYSMLWLPDRLVELKIDPERMGEASTTCQVCGYHFTNDEPGFWAHVLCRGYFPDTCNYCGCSLPEWDS